MAPATFWDSTLTTSVANPVTVNSGAQTTIGIALVATDITVNGLVTDQATGLAIPGASVLFQGSLPTSPATAGACNSNGTPPAQPSKIAPITTGTNGQFTVCLPPGSWAATFNEANFAQQKVSFQLDVGAAAKTLDVQMTESLNTVSGLVSEVIGQYGPAPLSALTAGDITVEDDGPNYCGNAGQSTCPIAGTGFVITAPGNGQYSVTGSGTSGTYFQPGENYSITFKVPGFPAVLSERRVCSRGGLRLHPQPDARCRHGDRRRRRRDERQRVADRRRQCVAHSSRAGEHTFALSHWRGRHPVLHERRGPGRHDHGQRRSGYVPERTPGRLPGRRGRVGGGGQHGVHQFLRRPGQRGDIGVRGRHQRGPASKRRHHSPPPGHNDRHHRRAGERGGNGSPDLLPDKEHPGQFLQRVHRNGHAN